ncbi:MAG: 50S ribosomal protein L29 [Patescibacteria group bacterium]
MKKSDKIAMTSKSTTELQKILVEKNKQLFEAKAKQFLGSLKDTSIFKKIRFEIAFVSSLIKRHQNARTK